MYPKNTDIDGLSELNALDASIIDALASGVELTFAYRETEAAAFVIIDGALFGAVRLHEPYQTIAEAVTVLFKDLPDDAPNYPIKFCWSHLPSQPWSVGTQQLTKVGQEISLYRAIKSEMAGITVH